MYVGLSDNAGGAGVSQSGFEMRFINAPQAGSAYVNFGANQISSARPDSLGGSGANMTYNTSTDYYVELQKNGTSLIATIRTGSHSGTQVATQTITTTITPSLKYLHFWNSMSSNTGAWTGTFEDIKFWNNATSTSGTPTYDYNLANASVWSQDPSDSQFTVSYSESNTDVNDIAHFENGTSANGVIGEKITSGNRFIGRTVNSISFWLYKLNSGSSGSETFTFGIWNSSGVLQKEFGSVTRGELPQGSSYTDAQKFTKTDSTGHVLQQNDIVGIRTNSAPSGWTVEVQQRDSDVYSYGQRAIFVQGSTPTTSSKDIGFEISSSDARINFLENASSGGDRTWLDLGTGVSETQWILRFKLRFTTIANQSDYPEIDLGISDNHANSDTNQDFIGCRILPMAANNLFRPRKCIAEKPRRGASASHNPSPAFTTGKDYYIEFKRTSATNWSASLSDTDAYDGDIYSGSFTNASTSLNGLRYFTVMDGTTATSGNMEGYIDVFEFYNDTTTAIKTAIGDEKPTNVELASRFEETDTQKIYYRMDGDYESTKWYELGTVPYGGGRGVFGGGLNTGSSADGTIDYVTIATLGNASDFGNLSQARYGLGSMANKTRTLFAGGSTGGGGNQTTIDFITPATLGNATDFGNISNDTSKTYGVMCLSSETRGIIAGGESSYSNRIDYVTIDTEGNSTTFGATLTVAGKQGATTSDGTRGVFIGGEGRTPTMDYITIGTTGTCTDFADLRVTLYGGSHGLATDGTIGVFTTGDSYSSNIEKITIAGTPSNSTNFGDMSTGRSNLGLASDKTRAIFAGGKTANGNNYTNTIEYSAIPTPSGNAADFGDLQVARQVLAGASDTGADRS